MAKDDKKFRPALFVQSIHQMENRDPDYEYKFVIHTYRHDVNRVKRYMDAGWEIVDSTEVATDDRSHTPNSKEEKLRPQPVTVTTKDGHQQVLMRCLRTKRAENEAAKKARFDADHERVLKQQGGKVTKRGNEIITHAAEINENNI